MCMYPMIDFYVESQSIAETSAAHHIDVLQRVFRQLEEYGVHLMDESIEGLTGAAVQRWFNVFRNSHKPATVNNYVVTVNPFFRWAHTIYPEIPDVSGVLKTVKLPDYDQLPDEEKPKEKYYTDEEISQLLLIPNRDSPLKKRDRAIIALFIGSGLRVSELCQLTIGHITEYKHGYVRVRRKGGAYKDVDVAEFVYKYIRTYLATRKDRNDPSAPLFVTTHGTPCNRKQIYESMSTRQKKVVGDAKQFGSHTLRHTFVSNVEKIGGAAVARDLANHTSLVMTNRYDHSTPEQRHEAVNAMRWG